MKTLRNILYNLNIILAGIFIIFQILDMYNPTMNFIGNNITIYLLFAFCIISIANACTLLIHNRKDK
jgi:hypothetical protein